MSTPAPRSQSKPGILLLFSHLCARCRSLTPAHCWGAKPMVCVPFTHVPFVNHVPVMACAFPRDSRHRSSSTTGAK
ncbi:hypothetical protein F5141DRAFT_1083758 [Pisolithus sp. B1]|nr:hypothetical protein F5141DRAFT_1083758 [Pisolithus sp. B1]